MAKYLTGFPANPPSNGLDFGRDNSAFPPNQERRTREKCNSWKQRSMALEPQDGGYKTSQSALARHLRLKEVTALVRMSPSTVWRMVKDRSFVQPIKLSERITVWSSAEIERWLEAKEGGR